MRKVSLGLLGALAALSVWAVDPPVQEVRAVWLATVYGLDWPSKPATDSAGVEAQKQELCRLLDKLQEANFNLVFLQVRARGDLIYSSAIEPASKVFSGKYGVSPGYDPLSFAIEECHKRGMECHAWMVALPVGTNRIVNEQGNLSAVKRLPRLCKRHKGEWYLDPGVPETADYLASLVNELVSNYNIDGIHLDYIRYPEDSEVFPDRSLYNKYGRNKSIEEWRRDNITRIVGRIYDEVKARKPWVQVSSAPLGKYNRIEKRPDASWTAYESVYQDPVLWLDTGKHDMIVPMMYYLGDDFFPFVDDWVENSSGRQVVPGLGAYRMDKKEAGWNLKDLVGQIEYSREHGAGGAAFFRCSHVVENREGLYDVLRSGYYKYAAKLPPLSWLSDSIPPAPAEIRAERVGNELKLSWSKPGSVQANLSYTIYFSHTGSLDTGSAKCILATNLHETEYTVPLEPGAEQGYLFSVSASSRYRIESPLSPETYYYQSEYLK